MEEQKYWFMEDGISTEELAEKIREVSIAEFFEKNRHLLGYENPTKSLFTVVKEAVDNSVDACIEARILPKIKVSIRQVGENIYKVRVEDNGPGLPPEKVPIAFGRFLVGSKFYRYRQSIGTQGIGIKGAILYAQLTTGKPAKITTYYKKKKHEFELMIDVLRNEPKIISHKVENLEKDLHGISIELIVEGRYIEKGQSIPTYLRYLWLANPYLEITYDGPENGFKLEPVVNELPPSPKEIKPHPYGVELGKFKRMLHLTNARTVAGFLSSEFSRVSSQTAEKICKLAKVDSKKSPKEVNDEEAERLHKAMQTVKLMAPPTDCLSPLKEDFLVEALKKEFQPEFVTAVIRKPTVYRGNPFQVQVALAYGGKVTELQQNQQTAILLRFANHTPLLYNQSDCGITRAVEEVDWRNYGLSQSSGSLPQAPLIIFVDFLSVWIPYKSEGKQAIAEYPEIIKEIKLALQEAGRRLAIYLHKKIRGEQLRMRANIFEAYSNVFSEFVSELTGKDVEYVKKKILELIRKGEYKEGEEKQIKEEVVEVK
jgi:DNA topoisomerase-6 subunit B